MKAPVTARERLLDHLLATVIAVLLAWHVADWLACLGMVC